MAKVYYRLIKDNKLTIEEVPERWRAATQALLDADKPQEVPLDPLAPDEGTSGSEEPQGSTGDVTSILDGVTVVQLREYAANNGVSLHGATRKEDIRAAIEAAQTTKEGI